MSQASSTQKSHYVVCVMNDDYPVSIELRKIYRSVPDSEASGQSLIRVVDESGEDYLYPADYFVPIKLPKAAEKAFSVSN
ncbi:MAG: hypothetical protein O2909_00870 [Chloroflexi bacterium]|nr:hypothetical protein [Chloroflexota bacterium]MDA1217980.1 hypothetical protein [Chloroflexota bacterium]PKB57694.1 MAG: hypothetical protein BZY73_01755 [SAR202 cluster bacterium Casp-Chloro-G3]